jgi:hypothetical protein
MFRSRTEISLVQHSHMAHIVQQFSGETNWGPAGSLGLLGVDPAQCCMSPSVNLQPLGTRYAVTSSGYKPHFVKLSSSTTGLRASSYSLMQ